MIEEQQHGVNISEKNNIKWICGFTVKERKTSAETRQRNESVCSDDSEVEHVTEGDGGDWAGGTAAPAPPPFRPSDPALCGSCPPVTPY